MGVFVAGPQTTRRRHTSPAFGAPKLIREPAGVGMRRTSPCGGPSAAGNTGAGIRESSDQQSCPRGEPLIPALRHSLEPRLGDLSRVRVHADAHAAASAESIGAAAFTWKDHVVFGRGRFSPETPVGRDLLAHELVHVAQQRSVGRCEQSAEQAELAGPDHPLERNAHAVLAGNAAPEPATHAMVQRQGTDEPAPRSPLSMRHAAGASVAPLPPVTLFPLPADLPRLSPFLQPGARAPVPHLPPLRLGDRPSPQLVGDTARDVWLQSFRQPEFRHLVIQSFVRAQGLPEAAPEDRSAPNAITTRDDLSVPRATLGGAADASGPDVTHQTLVGFDPQNSIVSPRSQQVRGSGVGVVVDQAAVAWNASAYQHVWHSQDNPAGDVTLSVLTSPTIQVQTEGFPQPASDSNGRVPSTVQQASFSAGGSLGQIQRGPDENPSVTVTVGQVTGGPQAGSVSPRFGGPAVPSPTSFVFGFTPLQVEVGIHRFCDGGRLGIGVSAGGQVGVTPGQPPVFNFSPGGLTFTYHEGNAAAARRDCR